MKLLGMFESNADFWTYPPVVHICYDDGTMHMDARSTSWYAQTKLETRLNFELKSGGLVWKRIL